MGNNINRGSRYIDRRTGQNMVNMASELADIAERLKLFGFDLEATQAMAVAQHLELFGNYMIEKLGKDRLRHRESEDGNTD